MSAKQVNRGAVSGHFLTTHTFYSIYKRQANHASAHHVAQEPEMTPNYKTPLRETLSKHAG